MSDLDNDPGNDPGEHSGGERDFVAEARAEGWRPLEQYKGDPNKWIDAEEFVKRGENILPLVKAQNSKLKAELEGQRQSLKEMRESMDNFKLFHEETTARLLKEKKAEYARAVADLKKARTEARENGDLDKVDEISDAIADLKAEAKAEETKTKKAPTAQSQDAILKDPVYQAWAKENPWFGDDSDKENARKSRLAVAVGQELRSKNPNISMSDFLEQITEEVESTFGGKKSSREAASKVEGSRRGAGGTGRSYADLPADARKQCDEDIKRHVGPNKVYKTAKEYQSYFANLYFEE